MVGIRLRMKRSLFLLPPVVQGLLTLISIPALIHVIGAEAWSRVVVGQAVGSIGAVIVLFGWSITGPALVAQQTSDDARATVLRSSLPIRLLLVPVVATVGAVIVYLLVGGDFVLPILGAVGAVALGLTNAWFFIGSNDPRRLLIFEVLPGATTLAFALVVLLSSQNAQAGLILQIAAPIVACAVSTFACLRGRKRGQVLTSTESGIRAQARATVVHLAQATFGQLPILAVAVLAPLGLPTFAVVDRIQKQLLTAAGPLGSVLVADLERQYRVGGSRTQRDHARQNLARLLIVALVGSVVTWMITPLLVSILTLGQISLSPSIQVLLAVAVGSTFVINVLPSLCLAPLGRVAVAARASVIGLIVVFVMLTILVPVMGTVGALLALIGGSVIAFALQLRAVLRAPSK